jgi:hypothetical protein
MSYNKATPVSDCPRRAIDFKNIDSLRYQYSLHPTKAFPTKFANHASITTTSYPSLDGFTRLSDGGSRDSVVRRYLAVTRDAKLAVETTDVVKFYTAAKHAVVLVEHLPNGTFRLSIPLAGNAPDDAAAEVEDAAASSPTA